MRYILALCLFLLPCPAFAGLLFGESNRTVIHNYGGSGYNMTYGRSYSYGPTYRTYRVYRSPVVTYSVAPQVGYYVPPPAAQAPVAAPADPAPVQDAPPVVYRSMPTYSDYSTYSVVDDAPVTKVRHHEKHKHGKHKASHKETSR
jgi:hypothetical protein